MRKDAMWGVVGVVAVMGVAACGGRADSPRVEAFSQNRFEIKRTACRPTQTDIDVDAWAVSTEPGATVNWIHRSGDAVVTIKPKNAGQWPFDDASDIVLAGGANVARTVSNDQGNKGKKFRFLIQVSCAGTSGHTVNIDPDIFVD